MCLQRLHCTDNSSSAALDSTLHKGGGHTCPLVVVSVFNALFIYELTMLEMRANRLASAKTSKHEAITARFSPTEKLEAGAQQRMDGGEMDCAAVEF